jgi:hypothetical protein
VKLHHKKFDVKLMIKIWSQINDKQSKHNDKNLISN